MTIGAFSSVVNAARSVVPDVITLSGSTGTPNNISHIVADPTDAYCTWEFRTDGTVYQNKLGPGYFRQGIEWCQQVPVNQWYIRFTYYSGDATNVGTIGSWLNLNTIDREVGQSQTTIGTRAGVTKVEISSDASGSPIVATGYYGNTATVEA